MSIGGPGHEQLRLVTARLKEAGEDGRGFRRELMKQLDAAAQPIARKIASPEHLRAYLPDPYADILAPDLAVGAQKIFAKNPRVSIRAKGRQKRRKVRLLDAGLLNHPVFARGPRKTWDWVNGQRGGMRAGFFSDPCEEAAPEIREHVLKALTETDRKLSGG